MEGGILQQIPVSLDDLEAQCQLLRDKASLQQALCDLLHHEYDIVQSDIIKKSEH